MGQVARNLRDMLILARMLRRFAQTHRDDVRLDEILSTARALEARAQAAAEGQKPEAAKDEAALHAPVNLLV